MDAFWFNLRCSLHHFWLMTRAKWGLLSPPERKQLEERKATVRVMSRCIH